MSETLPVMPEAPNPPRTHDVVDVHPPIPGALAQPDEPADVPTATPFWTVERALYGLAVLVAATWRVWGLGSQPLSAWEAANSWPAWLVAHGFSASGLPTPNSPLYYGLQWLLFWLGADSDAAARLVACVAGIGLVLVTWWWRRWLGRPAALVLAFLVATDPWAVALSRMADGGSLSLLLGFIVLTAIVNLLSGSKTGNAQWRRVGSAAAGLLLVSGPLGLNLLLVLAVAVWIWREELRHRALFQRETGWWLLGSALFGGSLFLLRLDGLAWLGASLSVWLSQFVGNTKVVGLPVIAGDFDMGWFVARLVVEGLLPLVLGATGLALTWQVGRQRQSNVRKWAQLMSVWLAWGGLLCLLPGRSPFALGVVVLPLALLAAPVVVAMWRVRPRDVSRQELGAVVATLLILIVSAAFWAAALGANPTFDRVVAQATLVIVGLGIAILLAFGVWSHRQSAAWITMLLLLALLTLNHLRAGWHLSHASIMEPSGWQVELTHPEIRELTNDIETLSALTEGDPYQVPVYVEVASYYDLSGRLMPARPDPVLGWALRRMQNLSWGGLPTGTDATGLVITHPRPDETVAPPLPDTYVGSEYAVAYRWEPSDIRGTDTEGVGPLQTAWQTRLQPWWRWVMYRQAPGAPMVRNVILWAPRTNPAITQ